MSECKASDKYIDRVMQESIGRTLHAIQHIRAAAEAGPGDTRDGFLALSVTELIDVSMGNLVRAIGVLFDNNILVLKNIEVPAEPAKKPKKSKSEDAKTEHHH